MVDDIGISSYDMCTGDYQFLLSKLRMETYGSEVTLKTTCPFCGERSEVKFNIDDLSFISDLDAFDIYKTFLLPKTQREITLIY